MIVVTAPTGNIGKQILEKLVDGRVPVRVIVRDASRIPAALRERIEIVEGSHGDAEVVNKAFEGADSVFWLVPDDANAVVLEDSYADFSRPACEAIKQKHVKRVVYVSALGRGWKKESGLVSASLKAADLIATTGVNLRVLTMPSFMDNLLSQAENIKETGVLSWPIQGDLKVPTVCTADIAATAAKFLLDDTWTGQADVPVLGPEDISMNQMAQIMSEVLGFPVRFEETSIDDFKQQMAGYGFSEAMVEGYGEMMTAKKEGMDNMVVRTPDTSTPTTFRQWCEIVLKPAVLG
jgi:uncharacterized protein YbjT (DUF2867 family)